MIPRSPLDDPRLAQFAWARYRRLMRWMMLATVTMVIGATVGLYRANGLVSIHFYIAMALGHRLHDAADVGPDGADVPFQRHWP